MKFFSNLPKQFFNSMVRQVGRDSGKVISNKMFKGKHGTPVYRTSSPYASKGSANNNKHIYKSDPIDISQIDMSVQPAMKNGGVGVVLKGLLIQIIPIIGTIAVLIKGISYFILNSANIYVEIPNRISDRRYREGYRIEGSSIVKTDQMRNLSVHERRSIKGRGVSYLISVVLFALILFAFKY